MAESQPIAVRQFLNSRHKTRNAAFQLVFRRVIAERRKTGEDREDLLSILLHAVDSEDSKTRMTDEQARDEAMVLF